MHLTVGMQVLRGTLGRRTRALLVPALVLVLGACAEDGTSLITNSVDNAPVQASGDGSETPAVPGESLQARLARLEYDLAQLKLDYSVVRPSFERLVAREEELMQRIAAVEAQADPITTASIRPSAPPAVPPEERAPKPAAAAPSAPPSPSTAVTAPVGLHLASYRSRAKLAEGWQELLAAHPAELSGMNVRVQRIDTGEGGVFQRLVAGPVNSRTAADGLCQALSAQGVYCKPLDFVGDAL